MMIPPATESASGDSPKGEATVRTASSLRTPRAPVIQRRVWVLGVQSDRVGKLVAALEQAGHAVRTAATGAELAPTLREFRPNLIVIDMEGEHDRGRHIATQLRADRATRQVPIVLAGARGVELKTAEKPITGPTRRYTLAMDAPSVINAIVAELL